MNKKVQEINANMVAQGNALFLKIPIADWNTIVGEIARLEKWIDDIQDGSFINCVYCGHCYGKDDGKHLDTMRDRLRAHIDICPEHPMSALRARFKEANNLIRLIRAKASNRGSLTDDWVLEAVKKFTEENPTE